MRFLIVTYHYIDDPKKYASGIYPISPDIFAKQLDEFSEKFNFISEKDLIASIQNKRTPEENECLVTFDDGLRCQFESAMPVLESRNIPAVFFLSTQQYSDKKANRVHKIHYLLSQKPPKYLLEELEGAYQEFSGKALDWTSINMEKIVNWYIYDDKITAIFKYLLNHLLPHNLSDKITDRIFSKVFRGDEAEFCEMLYLTPEQIKSINSHPLFSIGLHSHTHMDISLFPLEKVVSDLQKNASILREKFSVENIKGLSYPYGITDEEGDKRKIQAIAEKLNLAYGVTTEKGVNINLQNPFLLKRFNPNDIKQLS